MGTSTTAIGNTISLDGTWEFRFDPEGRASGDAVEPARAIQVPAPWQSQFADLHLASGVGWYRRVFEVPSTWRDATVLLRFGAVDYYAEVWLNGRRLGDHEGGYLPFAFEIQNDLHFDGPNELIVRAVDPGPDTAETFPAFRFAETPHGKQSWYGPLGGIWQSVTLERRGMTYLEDLRLTPNVDAAQVTVEADPRGQPLGGASANRFLVRVIGPEGGAAAIGEVPLSAGQGHARLVVPVPGARLWDLDDPTLYRVEVELLQDGRVVDHVEGSFGFRTIAARDGQIFLNGRAIYLRGALDQDYYPETISIPPSPAFLEDRFRKAKELGLNCLRCHIKVADPRYYDLADRMGLLVWTELPSWGGRGRGPESYQGRTSRAAERAWQTLEGIVRRDWNHPSIICWTIVNEDWGTKLPADAADRAWLGEAFDRLKALDPHRLVVDNSPCRPNFHVKSDLDDYHFYYAIPDHADAWRRTVEEFARRPAWTYSPHGDAARTGQEPLVVSEFGNWGLPNVHQLRACYGGTEPWWFDTGAEWGQGRTKGSVHPKGILERVSALGLDRVFGSYDRFVDASQEQEYEALKYEIEEMRRQNSIQGYVITELTDVHWECNGLLDQCDNPKVFHRRFHEINADDVVVPTLASGQRRAFWSGEEVVVDLVVSHFSRRDLAGATLRWWVSDATGATAASGGEGPRGQISLRNVPASTGAPVGAARFVVPDRAAPGAARFVVELRDRAGAVVARDDLTLYLFPAALKRAPASTTLGIIGSPETRAQMAAHLAEMGYAVSPDPRGADVVLSVGLTDEAVSLAGEGARVLALAEKADAVQASALPAPLEVVDRKGSGYEGDWASSFSWLDPGRLRTRVPSAPRLDWAFATVAPEAVILGPSAEQIGKTAWVGLFVGWARKPAALAWPVPLGRGTLLLTTFGLVSPDDKTPGSDPVATVLLADLIAELNSIADPGQAQP